MHNNLHSSFAHLNTLRLSLSKLEIFAKTNFLKIFEFPIRHNLLFMKSRVWREYKQNFLWHSLLFDYCQSSRKKVAESMTTWLLHAANEGKRIEKFGYYILLWHLTHSIFLRPSSIYLSGWTNLLAEKHSENGYFTKKKKRCRIIIFYQFICLVK